MSRSQRWRQIRKSERTWGAPALPLAGGLIGGALLALTASALDAGAPLAALWAGLFGFVAVALPLAAVQHAAENAVRQLRAFINIRPFTGDRLLAHDPWAMDALLAEQILSLIDEGREAVVELGSGHSTVLIAGRLEARGRGRVVAVDHLAGYADRTRRWLADAGLEGRAVVVHAPLADREVDGRTLSWYRAEALDAALPARIDLLVVDGPPALPGPDARWPAVPLLQARLAPGAAILMDDGDRPTERRAAFDWHRRLGGRMRYLPGGKGRWLLRLPT
ncbi:MAG TPA: class I SAM-dependent methyltransferase [Longimicrobiales bacterium]|nr:class I SAM-dependent methyltransferase [Longimicrobiales bacterium]